MAKNYDILDRVSGSVTIGGSSGSTQIVVGRMAEKGNSEPITFDGGENFVVLEVGKRGSGKSYGMASILEGFATQDRETSISQHKGDRRAVVLLDPLDIHWPALIPLDPSSNLPKIKEQLALHQSWQDLRLEKINVQVFVPAGYERTGRDLPGMISYQIPVREMSVDDWAQLLKVDLFSEPRGRAFDEAFRKVTELGWSESRTGPHHNANGDYEIADLVTCLANDVEIQDQYHSETIRSVSTALRSFQRLALFGSSTGTPMVEVAKEGVLSILSLGRLPEDLRTVVATVFVRKLKADRQQASDIRRRIALNDEGESTRLQLEQQVAQFPPRTILAIDEAQILLPAEQSSSIARKALDAFVLEGRNYGLSLWLATQRPQGAISKAAISQIDTFIVHRLSVADDVKAVCQMLQSSLPREIRVPGKILDMHGLIRSLDVGQAVFSSATSNASRMVVGTVRPRMQAHGGDSF